MSSPSPPPDTPVETSDEKSTAERPPFRRLVVFTGRPN